MGGLHPPTGARAQRKKSIVSAPTGANEGLDEPILAAALASWRVQVGTADRKPARTHYVWKPMY
jgi:hypothetical protein